MKISGFTICRNAIKYDFPIVEALQSALPIVEEFIVNVGQSDDGTMQLIQSINSPKIKIVESWWDDSMKKDGLLFSKETNVALSHCTGDWALYLQADEVLHQNDFDQIKNVLKMELPNLNVLGFSFKYHHFYGDYWSLNPWAYHRAVRIIRNNGSVESCGDAVGFCLKETGRFLQTRDNPHVKVSGAEIYHYGWVKSGRTILEKLKYQVTLYHGSSPPPDQVERLSKKTFDFPDYYIMKEFSGSHPAVMGSRIQSSTRLAKRLNRWLNPRFYVAILQKGFRG